MTNSDTIAAIATASGRGGVGIIRISGEAVQDIAENILGQCPKPRLATHRQFKNQQGQILDDGIAIYYPAPNSFTGEDVLELQGHGGSVVLDMLLNECLQQGARLAAAGEFSQRAFLNDKLDLAQAEAIADLIDSGSEQAARSALRSLQGEFSKTINELLQQLIELRVYVEAALDFPEEEIDFLSDETIKQRFTDIKQQLHKIQQKAQQGSLLREGIKVVIIGEPNVGKSSLLNTLAEKESAIVTDIAGTTRDVLRESINLDGLPLHIIDTAGLRESNDVVEKIGIERAQQEIENADLLLLLQDDSQEQHSDIKTMLPAELPKSIPQITIKNKIDISGHNAGKHNDVIYISARERKGIDILKTEIKTLVGFEQEADSTFIARRRHLNALQRTQQKVENAEQQLLEYNAGELVAEELLQAQDALSEITGKFTSDDLLGEIFSSFCIGK